MQHDKKLLNQTEIADKLGVNRSTVSRYIKEHSVAPKQLKGRQKLYDATILQRYKKDTQSKKEIKKVSTTNFLKRLVERQREEIKDLKQQVREKDEVIKSNNADLVELSKQLVKLTSQAQQLNLLDKPKQDTKEDIVAKNKSVTTSATKKKHWWNFRK